MTSLSSLRFDNRFVRDLPADPVEPSRFGKSGRRQVHEAAYSRVVPVAPSAPRLVACAREVAELIGLDGEACASEEFARVFSGAQLLAGMEPYAMCYGGHQFGHWAGQLGDGRAIALGQVVGTGGARWTLQLKGAGPTPYSRTADGLAVLRSSVREFLCSEAMHHLGVPTTRALSLVTTGDEVVRDMFYDGNARPEPGAIVCRVARSFTRLGNFELPASRGELDLLRRLADHTIRAEFPHLELDAAKRAGDAALAPTDYLRWFREVVRSTAEMVAHWMRVGFVHGVMNTDNLSVLGETIDYGPYGWLEDFDPGWTPNTTDAEGRRYAFGNQPAVAHWNLTRFASALVPLIDDVPSLQDAVNEFPDLYGGYWREGMRRKLGLARWDAREGPDGDGALVDELHDVLQLVETDMTWFFRALADIALAEEPPSDAAALAPLHPAYYSGELPPPEALARTAAWLTRYRARARRDGEDEATRRARMNAANPRFVLRNYLAQLAIDDAEKGDAGKVHELLEVLRRPYDEQPGKEHLAAKRPEWARHRAGCSMLSCSS